MLTIWCRHSHTIEILERELAFARQSFMHERQRAEVAIDELLKRRVGAGPVTFPLRHDAPPPEDDPAIRALLRDPEFTKAGGLDE